MTPNTPIQTLLADRRRLLRMSVPALARRSGVSVPTVNRILSDHIQRASLANVQAVAQAMGLTLAMRGPAPSDFKRQEAARKAEWAARQVQGTSALEAQAVSDETQAHIKEAALHDLLAGSARRLWG